MASTHHDDDHHDEGLAFDVGTLLNRRRALTMLGGASVAVALAACQGSSSGTTTSTTAAGATGTTVAPGSTSGAIPEETAGPFPGDGSNGVNVLTQSGIVRRDITHSFGSASGVAAGVPLTIELRVLDTKNSSKALVGAAVYLWHCNIDGKYSLYSQGVTEENYLRGVQATDSGGSVTFTSIFPAAYSGRWPHIHFEVYPSLAKATAATDKLRTSQLALPEAICREVFATSGYSTSIGNLNQTSLATDNVFSDGWSLQTPTMTGTVAKGLTATLDVPV